MGQVSCTVEDGVAQVRLDRPDKLNALTLEILDELVATAHRLRRDRTLRAVVVAGEGDAFCAGLDFGAVLRQPAKIVTSFVPRPWRGTNTFQEACWAWRRVPVPVVAAVHGHCLGGGLQIALAADFRFATPDSRWSVLEGKWGIIPDMSGIRSLAQLVGIDTAKRLKMTAETITGERARAAYLLPRADRAGPPAGGPQHEGRPRGGVPQGRSGVRTPGSMRFQRTLALVGVALLWLALGPWVLPATLATLSVPRVRAWLRPTWRMGATLAAVVLGLVGLVVLVPDGWLPIPPGPGALVTPRYVGRPAFARPIRTEMPQDPHLAPDGRSSMHDDAWATDSYPWGGPLGESPSVDTSWFGLEECDSLAVDSHDRLVGLCGDLHGPALHVIDPDSMNPVASKDLPDRADTGAKPWEDLCAGAYFFLDDRDRAVVATTDRRVLVVGTSDADGDPDLTTEASYDLSDQVPRDDCLLALMPDWGGDIWWVTQQGRVGTIAPSSGRVRVLDLGEQVANSFAVDRSGAYVVTTHALYRLREAPSGKPAVAWRTAYDRGSEQKSGQLSQGSGTTPTLLPGGLVAIADNADP